MKNNTTSNGIGVTGLLLVAFIVLKLVKVINWSWWWVLSPMWITIGLVIIILIAYWMITLIQDKKWRRSYYRKGKKNESN